MALAQTVRAVSNAHMRAFDEGLALYRPRVKSRLDALKPVIYGVKVLKGMRARHLPTTVLRGRCPRLLIGRRGGSGGGVR